MRSLSRYAPSTAQVRGLPLEERMKIALERDDSDVIVRSSEGGGGDNNSDQSAGSAAEGEEEGGADMSATDKRTRARSKAARPRAQAPEESDSNLPRAFEHAAAEGEHEPEAPPPPRTKWTRRVPHPVLIGHASLSQGWQEGEDMDRAGRRFLRTQPCSGDAWAGVYFDVEAKHKDVTVKAIAVASHVYRIERAVNVNLFACNTSMLGNEGDILKWELVFQAANCSLPAVSRHDNITDSDAPYGQAPACPLSD